MGSFEESMIRKQVLPYLSPGVKKIVERVDSAVYIHLEEIRLRCGKPLILRIGDREILLDREGRRTISQEQAYIVNEEDIYRTIASISDNSLYAFEEEIRRGFITVPGGHRVGLAGQVVVQGNGIKGMKDFSSICFRVARQVKGCAENLTPFMLSDDGVINTLVISPPRCGKTTVLRDISRILSERNNVVIVDERSEIAGCYRGIPQLDTGIRTDVLDACPKAWGMFMAIRSLSPQVIVTDEIGREEDAAAIRECVNAGVTVISSVHARNLEELQQRPVMKGLLASGAFKLGIFLSRNRGPGTLEEIVRWE